MAISGELATTTAITISFCNGSLLITAEGETPTPGHTVNIEQSPLRIFPPQYNVIQTPPVGFVAQVISPYKVSRSFPMATEVPEIKVHTADGLQTVAVSGCPEELSGYSETCAGPVDDDSVMATGRSNNLSFDEAFADAVAQLPPTGVADGLTRVTVVEVGGLFGGIAGFHELFVKIAADID